MRSGALYLAPTNVYTFYVRLPETSDRHSSHSPESFAGYIKRLVLNCIMASEKFFYIYSSWITGCKVLDGGLKITESSFGKSVHSSFLELRTFIQT